MRHQRRLLDQALNAAQTLRKREELAALQYVARVLNIPAQHGRDDAAITALHLLLGELMLRMARKAWVVHALDLGVTFQKLRHAQATRAVPLHTQFQCLDAAQREKGIERA